MKKFNKYTITLLSTLALVACSTTPDCPFGKEGERCEEITLKVYLPPVISDLSYQNVNSSKDQAIIQGGYQHTISVSGQVPPTETRLQNTSIQTFPLQPILDSATPEIQSVLFEFNHSELAPLETEKLESFLRKIGPEKMMHVSIEGHTDSRGSRSYNKQLSITRARSVRDYLIQHGVDASKISAKGFGESFPVESNRTAEGRAKNRRAELIPLTEK